MLDVSHLPTDFCIGNYVQKKYWSNDDFPDDGYTAFILEIKNHFQKSIKEAIELLNHSLRGFDAVAVVPSHQANGQISGMSQIASGLARCSQKKDATSCLQRHSTIQKLAENGNRAIGVHLKSITLHDENLIKDKRVLLLDDIRTTGNSLEACKQILQEASPKSVHPLALGQSCGPDACDPAENYHYADISVFEFYRQKIEESEIYESEEKSALERLKSFALGE